jgi:hypothetical protein
MRPTFLDQLSDHERERWMHAVARLLIAEVMAEWEAEHADVDAPPAGSPEHHRVEPVRRRA